MTNDPVTTSNAINRYYDTLCATLMEELPITGVSFVSFLTRQRYSRVHLMSSNTWLWCHSNGSIKKNIGIFCNVLHDLYNLSLIPKISKITSIYKNNDSQNVEITDIFPCFLRSKISCKNKFITDIYLIEK